MAATTTVVLGAGFGGIVAARTLRSLLPPPHRIVLVSKTTTFHVGAAKTWVALGEEEPSAVTRPLTALERHGIELVHAEVRRLSTKTRSVTTDVGEIRGDFLVVALGADVNMHAIEGLAQGGETFYELEGAVRLRGALASFAGGELVLLIPRTPFKCPPGPYEAMMLLHHHFRTRGLLDSCRLSLFTVEPAPMPTAGPQIGQLIRGELEKREIAYHPQKRTAAVDPVRRVVRFEDGSEARFDLLIAIPPHECPRAVRESGIVDDSGWIPVDRETLALRGPGSAERVWAIGDVTTVSLPGRYKPDVPLSLPKAGVMAEAQGRVVASAIAAEVLGRGARSTFDGTGYCYVETGNEEALRGDGAFFALPHPRMVPTAPDRRQYQEKKAWAREWIETNLGGGLDR